MVSEYSRQEPLAVNDEKGSAAVILWSLVLSSSVGLGLLVWLGTNQDLLPFVWVADLWCSAGVGLVWLCCTRCMLLLAVRLRWLF